MIESQEQLVKQWVAPGKSAIDILADWQCETRDIFQSRLERMTRELIRTGIDEDRAYTLTAIVGEIGNNSFDHNIGGWPDTMGIWFFFEAFPDKKTKIILADRGRGVLATLKRVKGSLATDAEALETAFTEKLSGRAPENRGNGLKFVRSMVSANGLRLTFSSGNATMTIEKDMKVSLSDEISGCLAIVEA